jgi:uncharacterized BrkB/YihY/UPF0761 family membrane protein
LARWSQRLLASIIYFKSLWEIIQWPLSLASMFLSFSLIYYFGPDVRGAWHWVTPGAALGVAIWLLASFGFRIYLHFFNSYGATYGSLGAVIILLLWLYITGLAILIGAELNWVIEEEDKNRAQHDAAMQKVQRQMKAAVGLRVGRAGTSDSEKLFSWNPWMGMNIGAEGGI